jgi:allophanate hydrolase
VNARLEVVASGALATIQDLGRLGLRRSGVPWAGALDPARLRIANALAGNAQGAPAVEFFVTGPTLRAVDAPVRLAFAGDFPVELEREGRKMVVESWRSLTLQPGESVRAGPPAGGRVGYIAVAGLAVPPVLGSAATYTRAGLGGVEGRALASGMRLVAQAQEPGTREAILRQAPEQDGGPIRVVLGPQDDYFTEEAIADFLSCEFRVSPQADRMGIRLEGPTLRHRADKGAEIISDATVPGSIQVPGNGQPIVLLADAQTAGGYPKIATVASADLPRLAVASVGAAVRFRAITVAEAETLARQREEALGHLLQQIVPMTLVDGVDLEAIYQGNLVSGVVDALAPEHIFNALE